MKGIFRTEGVDKGGVIADFRDIGARLIIGRWIEGRVWKSDLDHTEHICYVTEGEAEVYNGDQTFRVAAGEVFRIRGAFRVEGGAGFVVMHLSKSDAKEPQTADGETEEADST